MTMIPIRRNVPVKGMNTVVPERSITEEYSQLLENIWYDDGITLRRRLCHSVANVSAIPGGDVKNIFEYSYRGVTKLFIQAANGTLYIDNGSTFTSFRVMPFVRPIGSAMLKSYMIFSDGALAARKYDGTGDTPITTPPSAPGDSTIGYIFHVHKGRCYAAGNSAWPLTVFISDTFTSSGVDYWSTTASATGERGYFIDITGDIGNGDVITGITTHRGFLVVLCRNHILFYSISESSSGFNTSLYKAIEGDGCIDHKSIQSIGEEVIFLAPNGFKKLSLSLIQGDSQVSSISTPINNDVKAEVSSPSFISAYAYSTYNPKYGLYVCNVGNVQWVYQVQFDGWFKWVGMNPVLFTDSNLDTYASGAYQCKLLHSVFQDELTPGVFTPVNMKWDVASFRATSLEHKPRWRKVEFLYETGSTSDSITIGYFRDLDVLMPIVSAAYTLTPTKTLANGLKAGRLELPITGRSELISFNLSNNNNSDFRMKIVEVYMNDGGIR